MRIKRTILCALIMGVVMIASARQAAAAVANVESEKAAIAKVIHDSIAWALTKDTALQASTMAHDEDLAVIWTSSDSAVFGWTRFAKLYDVWMDPRFKATLTDIRDLRINMSPSGDVAWFSAMLDDLGEWDGKPIGARDIRWTGVLEKQDGKWVFVQMHGSRAEDTVLKQARENSPAP